MHAEPEVREPTGLRARKKLQTRKALHTAALDLVEEVGLSVATVEAICCRAQVSPRTFFNYYPSKGAAALGLPEVDSTCVRAHPPRRDEDGDDLLDEARALVVGVLRDAGGDQADRAAVKAVMTRRPELLPELLRWLADLKRAVVASVGASDSRRSIDLAASLVLAALVEAISAAPDDRALEERLETALEAGRDLFDRWRSADVPSSAATPAGDSGEVAAARR